MNTTIILILTAVLVVNVFNIAMLIRVVRWIGANKAFSEDKAITLSDPLFDIYLLGPMASWSSLKRTKDEKYWLETDGWTFIRISMFALIAFLLFVNIYWLLYFMSL